MKLTDRVNGLKNGTSEEIGTEQLQTPPTPKAQEQANEVIVPGISQTVLNWHLSELDKSIEKLNNSIYCFAAATSKIVDDKMEIEKLTRAVAAQKVDVGTILKELDYSLKKFPAIATSSVQSYLVATSKNLDSQINGFVAEIRHTVVSIFKDEVKLLKQAASEVNKNAGALKEAKEYIGWKFLAANTISVIVIALIITLFVTPTIRRNVQSQDDIKYITWGKSLEAAWPKLSEKTRREINEISTAQQAQN
ncbi:hypothetical protein HXX01_05585 [Candidatus Nomurabacteria bacterium]|nr:hypothetical protein [Candidatus Nomurabacteria bacterium]